MIKLLFRLSTRENCILLLTLAALSCLPLSLKETISDASFSLLLPVTILGGLFVFLLASTGINKLWMIFTISIVGPLILFIRISQVGGALFATIRETLALVSNIFISAQGSVSSYLDLSNWLGRVALLFGLANGFGYRLSIWMLSIAQNKPFGDLAARAFVWSLGLWLIAAWASWQIRRYGKTLIGLTPATILLGLILFNTNPRSGILWLYLSALILILGITNLDNLLAGWKKQGTDYADSIWEDTLTVTLVMALGLVLAAYVVSSFSIKEILDRLNEKSAVSASASTKSGSAVGTGPQIQGSLPTSHAILGGPTLSQDVVMLISTGDFPPMSHAVDLEAPTYHWRAVTYETYTGSGWTNPTGTNEDIQPDQMLMRSTPANYRIVHQVVTFPAGYFPVLYWTGTLVRAGAKLQITWRSAPRHDPASSGFDPLSGGDMVGVLISGPAPGSSKNYQVESILPEVSETELRAAPASYPVWVTQRYLALPVTVPERVRALARDLTANAPTPYEQAVAIETYLRHIPYSLNVPAPPINQDAADYFLFDLKKGYCDYYATAMTVLARAVGLPARLVIGYASGSYDPYNAQYVVRQADAHAWTEIYFSGIGWIEFEPTGSQPAIFRVEGSKPPPRPVIAPQGQETWGQIATLFSMRSDLAWKSLLTLIILFFLWQGIEGLRLSLLPPSFAIEQVFKRLRNLARPLSGEPATDETANEYATALTERLAAIQRGGSLTNWLTIPARVQINVLTNLYIRSLFSPRPLTHADIGSALQTWNRLRWRLILLNILQNLKAGFLRPDP